MSELRRITRADLALAIISLMGMEPKNMAELEELKRKLQGYIEEPTKEKELIYQYRQRAGDTYPL